MNTSTVTTKGQITIPIAVRRRLNLVPGSRVEFVERPDGSFELVAATRSIKELEGVIKYAGPPVSIEDMDDAIRSAASERFEQLP